MTRLRRVLFLPLAGWEHWVSLRGIVETRLSDPPTHTLQGVRERASRRGCFRCTYGLAHRGSWRWA